MRKLKYIKLFEAYTDKDFEITNEPTSFTTHSSNDNGKHTTSKFIGKLTPEHQNLLDDLKDMFIDGSFKGVSSGDGGAIVGSNAGKRNVDHIVFKFAFYQPTTILYVFVKENSYMVSVEHPNNASDNIEEEFKTKYDLLKFIGGMGRLKKYMK